MKGNVEKLEQNLDDAQEIAASKERQVSLICLFLANNSR